MRRRLALGLLAALTLAACGRKGPPVAPEVRVPAPPSALTAVVQSEGVALSWVDPARRVDGTRLRDLVEARIYRVEDAGEGPAKPAVLVDDRIAGWMEIARLRLAEAPGARGGGARAFVDRSPLRYGRRYTYAVVVDDARGRTSAPSPRASVVFLPAPEPVTAVRVEPGDREVRLTWDPPARLVEGTPARPDMPVYEVLRAMAPDAAPDVVTAVPITETEFVDRGLDNDRTYYYAIRPILRQDASTAAGQASAPVPATPARVTPPSPPTSVVAVVSPGTVQLSWRPSPEPDVAGYIVYRAAGGAPFERVGSVGRSATVFIDREVSPGTYRYAVTAYDASVRANESPRSAEVSVTVP
jgi:predicted small lipoprotein YifL